MRKETKRYSWKQIIGVILFVTLILSILYSAVSLFTAPSEGEAVVEFQRVKSDYTLMLIQCIGGVIVMFVPSFLERRWRIDIPNYAYITYFIFLYCAIYLGEIRRFYFVVPHWDTYLHTFSGGMLGAMGFSLVSILNDNEKVPMTLSPFFIAMFSMCFALAAGAIWEIYEYTLDGLMGLNMQHYHLVDGTPLMGRAALYDTMKDLIVDALGALVVSVIGYIALKRQHRRLEMGKANQTEPA